jgi:hypothetical protein
MTTNITSQKLSQFVQDERREFWKQVGRKMPEAQPTRVAENYLPTNFVDTRAVDSKRLSDLLRSVGIRPLIGYPLGSPIQRLHISSEITELKEPRIRSLQDIALLSLKERTKILERRKARYVAPPPAPLLEDPDFGEQEVQQRPGGFVAALGTDPEEEDEGVEESKAEEYEAAVEEEEKETGESLLLAAQTPQSESDFGDTPPTDFTLGGAGSVGFTSMRDSPAVRQPPGTPLPSTPDFGVEGFLGARPYDEGSVVTEELASPRDMGPPRMPVRIQPEVIVIDSPPGFGDAEVPVNVHQSILTPPATPELTFTPIPSPAVEDSSPSPAAARRPARAAAADEDSEGEEGELPEEKEEEEVFEPITPAKQREIDELQVLLINPKIPPTVTKKAAFKLASQIDEEIYDKIDKTARALRKDVKEGRVRDPEFNDMYAELKKIMEAPETGSDFNSRALSVKSAARLYGNKWFLRKDFQLYANKNGIPFGDDALRGRFDEGKVDENAWGHFLPYFQGGTKSKFIRVNPEFFR